MGWHNRRPPNWEQIREEIMGENPHDYDSYFVEAGADAMLEALKKTGVWVTKNTGLVKTPTFEKADGYIVFIKDEEIDVSL